MSVTDKHPVWRHIDAVVVVNLAHRKDRWEQLCRNLEGKVPKEKLFREEAVYGIKIDGYGQRPWFRSRTNAEMARARAGAAGCLLSHRSVLERSVRENWNIVLHIEDDIMIPEGFDSTWEKLERFLDSGCAWDLIYLGHVGWRSEVGVEDTHELPGVFRLPGVTTTHAFLVSSQSRPNLLRKLPGPGKVWSWISFHEAIDTWFSNWYATRHRVYGIEPHIIGLTVSQSDIEGYAVDWKEQRGERVIKMVT